MKRATAVFAIAVLSLFAQTAMAGLNRWTTHSPAGASVISLAQDAAGETVYAVATGKGLYRSSDGGEHWKAVDGLPRTIASVSVDPLNGSTAYAADDGNLYRTADGGASWTRVSALAGSLLNIAAGSQGVVYAAYEYEVVASTDGGATWRPILQNSRFEFVTFIDGRTYAGTGTTLFFTDDGVSWHSAPQLPVERVVAIAAAADRTTLYAATPDAVYRSNDRGNTWHPLPAISASAGSITALATAGPSLFAGTSRGVFRYDGNQWTSSGALQGKHVNALIDVGSKGAILAGTAGGTFKSHVDEDVWTGNNGAFGRAAVNDAVSVPLDPDAVLAATAIGMMRSPDRGTTWAIKSADATTHVRMNSPDTAYATTRTAVLKSSDGGEQWSSIRTSPIVSGIGVSGDGKNLYAAFADGMAKSMDGGTTWLTAMQGIDDYDAWYENFDSAAVAVDPSNNDRAYVVHRGYLYRTTTGGGSWSAIAGADGSAAIAFDPATPARMYVAQQRHVLVFADDSGAYTPTNDVPDDGAISALAVSAADSSIYAGTTSGSIYRRPANGTDWTRMDDGLTGAPVNAIAVNASGTALYAATPDGLYEYDAIAADLRGVAGDATYVGHLLDAGASSDPAMFLIPIAGAGGGAYGAVFSTDIALVNSRSAAQDVVIAWLPAGATSPVSAYRVTIPAAPNGSLVLDSITERLGVSGLGALLVTAVNAGGDVDGGAAIDGSGLIWTTTTESGETLQRIASIHPAAFQARTSAIARGLHDDTASRTNVGIVNLGTQPQSFVVSAQGERHSEQFTVMLAPMGVAYVPLPNGDYGAVDVTVSTAGSARWTSFATSVDNATGSAMTVVATP